VPKVKESNSFFVQTHLENIAVWIIKRWGKPFFWLLVLSAQNHLCCPTAKKPFGFPEGFFFLSLQAKNAL